MLGRMKPPCLRLHPLGKPWPPPAPSSLGCSREGMSEVCGSWREPFSASPRASATALISSGSQQPCALFFPKVLDQNMATRGKSSESCSSPSGCDQQSEAVTSKPIPCGQLNGFTLNNMTGNGRGGEEERMKTTEMVCI